MSFMERRLEDLYRYLGVAYLTSMVVIRNSALWTLLQEMSILRMLGWAFGSTPETVDSLPHQTICTTKREEFVRLVVR